MDMVKRAILVGACLSAMFLLPTMFTGLGEKRLVAPQIGPPGAWGRLIAAAGGGIPAEQTGKGGLHLPQGKTINFNYTLTDGGSFTWDLQGALSVQQGTNSIYSGGMYCQVQNSNWGGGQGWVNDGGDEVEIGPWNRGECLIYRRCKVYKDQPFARWLDIFVNNNPQPITLQVRIYSNFNYGVSRVITSSGGGAYGEKDWAFVTDHQRGGGNAPNLLHLVCGPKSKLRPTVQTQGNSLSVNYAVTVPASGTAVLCYWESQGNTVDDLQDRLKKFRLSRMLGDLSPAVRKLILNLGPVGDTEGVELERSGTSDAVLLSNGDSIFGSIANPKYTLTAFYGTLELPATQVIGFAGVPGQEDLVRAVLSGGQVLTGKLKDDKLKLTLPVGGDLDIPFARIRQCSYRVSKDRPEEQPMTDPLILLRTGDRLAFDPAQLKCSFQTRHGAVELSGKDLLEVRANPEEHGVHRAMFLNGSTLGGLLGPERLTMPLKLGPRLDIPRDMVSSIRFAEEGKEPENAARALLNNEDELFGKLADLSYDVVTDFNTVQVKTVNILGMAFDPEDPTSVAVKLWDGSTLRGRLKQQSLRFQLSPGPTVELNVGQIVVLECPNALPPDEVVKQVEKLVALLGSANYKDRQDAQEALLRMGGAILPILQKYVRDNDPEVRQRVTVIIEKLGGKTAPTPSPAMTGDAIEGLRRK